MGELKKWASENSRFIKLSDGESFEGTFEGFAKSKYMGKEIIEYSLSGKTLSSSSGRLALVFDSIKPGTKVKVTRTGEGLKTFYDVEIAGKPTPKDDWPDEEVA